MTTAINTPTRVYISCLRILSFRRKLAKTQTTSGVMLQTMPTVDTLKYFRLVKEINIDKAPYEHRKIRLGRLSRSRESIKTFFKFLLSNPNIIVDAITPRAKVI